MGIKTSIYCGHDFSEEEGRLNLVIKTCKRANIPVPPEVYEKLNEISDGRNRIEIQTELEGNDESKRFRIKTTDIKNTKADYIYFEFKKFKSEPNDIDADSVTLDDIVLEAPEPGPIKKFFKGKDEGDYEYL